MVGYEPHKISLTAKEHAVIVSTTSILTRMLIQPFDVIKIRYQVQYEPISSSSKTSKYKTLLQTVGTITREEGILGLWKGHLTGQILSLTFTNAQFFWFECLTRLEHEMRPSKDKSDHEKMLVHFICGGLAACITVITNQPMDTIRTRLVTQGEPRIYSGIIDALRKIYAKEGFRAYYRGLVPSLFLVAPETAFRFGIYKFLNNNWAIHISNSVTSTQQQEKSLSNSDEIGFLQSSINGSLAGVCAKTVVYPFDLAKKRLQIQGFEEARKNFGMVVKFNGILDCFCLTIKKEGFFGIYKGYLPSMLKASVSSGLVFFFYESFTNLTRRLKSQ